MTLNPVFDHHDTMTLTMGPHDHSCHRHTESILAQPLCLTNPDTETQDPPPPWDPTTLTLIHLTSGIFQNILETSGIALKFHEG